MQLDHAGDAEKLARLSEVASGPASEDTPETLGRALAALKEELGMDVAFVSRFDRRRMVFRRLVGDGGSFGWREGGSIPLDDTFCRLLTEGRLPSVVPDAGADGRVRGLDVTGEAREQLFLVLREAVRNAASHSGAAKISVSVVVEGKRVVGAVEDDGRGFEKTAGPEESGGLAHMAERTSLLGGTCSVESSPGEGTRVEVNLPVGGAGRAGRRTS